MPDITRLTCFYFLLTETKAKSLSFHKFVPQSNKDTSDMQNFSEIPCWTDAIRASFCTAVEQ